jgi:hypothetical protein
MSAVPLQTGDLSVLLRNTSVSGNRSRRDYQMHVK